MNTFKAVLMLMAFINKKINRMYLLVFIMKHYLFIFIPLLFTLPKINPFHSKDNVKQQQNGTVFRTINNTI